MGTRADLLFVTRAMLSRESNCGVCVRQIGLFVIFLSDVNLKTGEVKSD
jgi:hypothetical protein